MKQKAPIFSLNIYPEPNFPIYSVINIVKPLHPYHEVKRYSRDKHPNRS